jgi:hypothetical protein
MTTETLEMPEVIAGTEIYFDNEGFLTTVRDVKANLIPVIIALRDAVNNLGLKKPFNNETFSGFINGDGARKAGEEFRKLVEKDMKIFKNPIQKFETSNKIEEWIKQIAEPTKKVKEAFTHFNNNTHRYKISCADFEIDETNVSINEDRIRQHFTTFATELQATVYQQFKKLEAAYNETIDFLKANNFQFASRIVVDMFNGRSMIDRYNSQIFRFKPIQGDILGPYIEVDKKILTLFK